MKHFMDLLSSAALSFTVSGNTGIAPFLTLFLVGAIEKSNPDILNMGEILENLLSSWLALVSLAILSILESIGHCIPVVDELMDSAVTFIVPVMSILGSLSTFGVLALVEEEGSDDANNQRELLLGTLVSGAMISFQIFVVLIGVGLALSMHLFKMLVRLAGEGWLTQILTIGEITFVAATILIATYIRPMALITGGFIVFASGYSFKKRYMERRTIDEKEETEHNIVVSEDDHVGGEYVSVNDVEENQQGKRRPDINNPEVTM